MTAKIGSPRPIDAGEQMVCVAHKGEEIEVVKHLDGTYSVYRAKLLRHPQCDAEAVMAALAFYLHDGSI